MSGRYRQCGSELRKSGTYYHSFYGTTDVSGTMYLRKEMLDTIGNFPNPNGLWISTRYSDFPVLFGTKHNYLGQIEREFNHCPVGARHWTPPDPGIDFPEPTDLAKSEYAWDTMASTNPSVPHVSVPVFVGELKDLPLLVKDWGGNLLRKVAKGHLTWRWAVKPMMSDIAKMTTFVDAVDKRVDKLRRLRDTNFLNGRAGLAARTDNFTEGTKLYFFNTLGDYYSGYVDTLTTEKVWGSAQWRLDPGVVLPKSAEGLRKLALQITFGIDGYESLATAWELLPWSWFIDWFTSIGDAVASGRNTVPCTASNICLMQTLKSKVRIRLDGAFQPTWSHLEGHYADSLTVKRRYVISTIPPFVVTSLPFLDGGKWSILGSLAVLKSRRGR